MKKSKFDFLAIAYNGGGEIGVFDKTDSFMLYYLADGKAKRQQYLSLSGPLEERVQTLKDCAIDRIICKNFPPKAMAKLREAGFALFCYDGGTDAAFRAYLAGELREL